MADLHWFGGAVQAVVLLLTAVGGMPDQKSFVGGNFIWRGGRAVEPGILWAGFGAGVLLR